jgi:hypothetical protein
VGLGGTTSTGTGTDTVAERSWARALGEPPCPEKRPETETYVRLGSATADGYRAQLAASDATVTSIVDEYRAHAIRFSDCRRSSIAWKAAACAREA